MQNNDLRDKQAPGQNENTKTEVNQNIQPEVHSQPGNFQNPSEISQKINELVKQ